MLVVKSIGQYVDMTSDSPVGLNVEGPACPDLTTRVGVRHFWVLVIGAASIGVVLRWWYVLTAVRQYPLAGDAGTYHLLGRILASGDGYLQPRGFLENGQVIPTAEFPPLWPTVLATFDLVGLQSVDQQRLATALLAAGFIVAIGALGRAVVDPVTGIVAAWLAAIYPRFVVYGGALLSEGFVMLIVTLLLFGAVSARRTDDPRLARRWWWFVSVAMAAAVMTRSDTVLLLPLLLVPATRVTSDPRQWLRRFAVVASCTVLVVSVWTVRNAVSLGGFVPLSNNSSTLLAGANCDATYRGEQRGSWRFDCIPHSNYDEVGEIAVSRANRDAGIAYLREHTADLPLVVTARFGRTLGVWDIKRTNFLEALEGLDYEWLRWAWASSLAAAALAIVGGVSMHRRRLPVWILLSPFAVVFVVTATAYGHPRFRAVAEPSLVIFAAAGVVALARRAGVGRTRWARALHSAR